MSEQSVTTREVPRLGLDAEAIGRDFWRYLADHLGRDQWSQNNHYNHLALVLALRDRVMERWQATSRAYYAEDCR